MRYEYATFVRLGDSISIADARFAELLGCGACSTMDAYGIGLTGFLSTILMSYERYFYGATTAISMPSVLPIFSIVAARCPMPSAK